MRCLLPKDTPAYRGVPSVGAERCARINSCRAPSRQHARRDADDQQKHGSAGHDERISRRDAIDERGDKPAKSNGRYEPHRDPRHDNARALSQYKPEAGRGHRRILSMERGRSTASSALRRFAYDERPRRLPRQPSMGRCVHRESNISLTRVVPAKMFAPSPR